MEGVTDGELPPFNKSFVRRGVDLKEKQRTCADCLKYFSCLDPFRLLHPEPLITPNDHKAKTCPSFIPAGVILMPSELPPFQSRGQDGGRMTNNYLKRLVREALIRMMAIQKGNINLKLALPTISGGYVRFDKFAEKWLGRE